MSCETAFTRGELVGFSFTRLSVYLESCMTRSASKTFKGLQDMQHAPAGRARESSSLHIA